MRAKQIIFNKFFFFLVFSFGCKAVPTTGQDFDKTDASSVNPPQNSRPCLNRHHGRRPSALPPSSVPRPPLRRHPPPDTDDSTLGRHNRFLWCEVRLIYRLRPAVLRKKARARSQTRGNRAAGYTFISQPPFALRHLAAAL
ncbi:hypothetical protein QR685DRAFT_346035 [Neurospora intermedia]|uniref:Secreted protein n=1 Tax=Neurospora intermedia TaxID=5142 RepID=A0ABR3D537_NEUIN